MLAVKGYFDGNNYIVEENVVVKPNQRVIITFLDDDFDASATSEKKRATETLHKIQAMFNDDKGWNSEQEMIEDLANFRRERLSKCEY